MTLDAHVTGIWCGQIGGGVGKPTLFDPWTPLLSSTSPLVQLLTFLQGKQTALAPLSEGIGPWGLGFGVPGLGI